MDMDGGGSWAERALASVMEPGVHPAMFAVVNVCLFLVLCIVALLAYFGHGNIHWYAIAALSVGLAFSVNLFYLMSVGSDDTVDERERDKKEK